MAVQAPHPLGHGRVFILCQSSVVSCRAFFSLVLTASFLPVTKTVPLSKNFQRQINFFLRRFSLPRPTCTTSFTLNQFVMFLSDLFFPVATRHAIRSGIRGSLALSFRLAVFFLSRTDFADFYLPPIAAILSSIVSV